ncbi:3'-5' exonuclease [uncultured Tyzzerella sp.]|uniref:3'-5' exonuclease n=1 Tax=uncultured Tyzzerella sp. TaxID=2321398 RepID=UPI00294396B0|nr:3'-5' exonuclease [uncultured Tyzzerella sp.]
MHKDFLNNLIKKSDLKNTDYFVYNQSKTKKSTDVEKITFNKLSKANFKDYIVLDFETTGLSPINDKIIEIGAIKVKDNIIIDKFDTLINPKMPIPPFISNKINITNEMVKDKPFIEDIFKDFIKFLEYLPLVIHNAKFDMGFLINNCKNLSLSINNPALDTVSTTKILFPELKKYNLAFLCNHFNISNPNAHRAMSDVLATYELYKILYNETMKKTIS